MAAPDPPAWDPADESLWPERTNWTTEGGINDKHRATWVKRQADQIERQRSWSPATPPQRLADHLRSLFRYGRCRTSTGGCGRRGMVIVRYWLDGYIIRRCRYCARWSQEVAPTYSAAG